jgi:hypothetical protein
MNLFQKMILNTVEKQLGSGTESFVRDVTRRMNLEFEDLKPEHMEKFSEIVFEMAEPRVGKVNAKSMAGIISHFGKSRL